MAHSRRKVAWGAAALGAVIFSGAALGQIALPDSVEIAPLATDAFSTGTLDASTGALPPTLWRGATPQTLEFLLDYAPARLAAPSLGDAMRRILLSPGDAPDGAPDALGGKKLLALSNAGFLDEAATIASLSTAGRGNPWTSQALAIGDLLAGDIQSACRRAEGLVSGQDALFWVKLRVLCYAESGEYDAADLSLGILRDQFGLSEADDAFLSAAVTGASPKTPPTASTALHYAAAKAQEMPFSPSMVGSANGGVLVALARDTDVDLSTRLAAAQRAAAMGVLPASAQAAMISDFEFDVAELSDAALAAETAPNDPRTDALLYQSIEAMSAPEFLRDKAQRIALALSIADSFHRAFALSALYADDIIALEGAIVAPSEAAEFAAARMLAGDSVGAGRWLSTMIGVNASVGALPEGEAMAFIDLVNLLALLDPSTAAQIARAANVSTLNSNGAAPASVSETGDPAAAAYILEAAFDAALGDKAGQAGLAALAASAASGPEKSVVIRQSLRAAGLEDLQRRFGFEQAFAARFPGDGGASASDEAGAAAETGGFGPSLKPRRE